MEVITADPYADAVPPDYKLSYAFNVADKRAQADPTSYAQPYISSGALYAPVTIAAAATTDVRTRAAQVILLPPDLTPPDEGTDDVTSVPPPQDKETVAAQSATSATPTAEPSGQPDLTVAQKLAEAIKPQSVIVGGVPIAPKVGLVKYSLSQLDTIKDEVIALTPVVLPGADKITGSYIQAEKDRVVVEASEASDEFRTALATRYGPDAVVIRLLTDSSTSALDSRPSDSSSGGFYGGSLIGNYSPTVGSCSDGFSWRYSGYHAMLTAGHCTGLGWTMFTPREDMGHVVKDTWANNSGTGHIDGQSAYHGDASMIKIDPGKSSAPRIYVGSSTSAASRAVAGMYYRSPAYGDKYCTGGATTGELCGWRVDTVRFNHRYSDGTVARNMTRGSKQGKCTRGGDSGGPVYTVNSEGKVLAKGIHSGTGGGGTDSYGGAFDPCHEFFTDIWEVYYGFPGTIAIG
ncbi:hypothetical protein [Nonomuraea sp. CA-141351]|uniref:hypothetical protein n=1 Tax=Nonomuraea sp. CA-141351 TaxID=3239996 RepID=UPI003D8FBD32